MAGEAQNCLAVIPPRNRGNSTLVIALVITLRGEKVLLGFVQTGTENATTCAAFLRSLLARGLRGTDGLLVVIDGGKGLRRAVDDVFGAQALVQRCVWHKRENVVDHLPKRLQTAWRAKLQQAYRRPTYETAYAELHRLHGELRRLNEDAAKSLAEGLEETLTLHRLGLADRLGTNLSTTDESVKTYPRRRSRRKMRADAGDPRPKSGAWGWKPRRAGCASALSVAPFWWHPRPVVVHGAASGR